MQLKKFRLSAGKTQAEVARALNITQFTYSNYEKEKTEPSAETVVKLADYFHTTIDSLYGHTVPFLLDKSTLSSQQISMIDLITQLSDSLCEKVEAYTLGLMEAELEKQKTIEKFKK